MGRNNAERYLGDILRILDKQLEESKSRCITTEDKIQKVEKILNQNYLLPITLSWLAKKVELNPYYLSRMFKKMKGKSIFEYLNKIRMGKSFLLLKSTDEPIKKIAQECGFKSVYYFGNCFKKYFSMPPGKVRKGDRLGHSCIWGNAKVQKEIGK